MKKVITTLLTAVLSAFLLSGYISTAQDTAAAQSAETSSADTSSADGSSADKTDKSAAGSSANNVSYTIRVGQFTGHDSLGNCREGFMTGLAEEDIEEDVDLTVFYDNPQANGGTTSQVATDFIREGVNLVYDIVTPMARAEYGVAEGSDIPVTFTAITGPAATELANADDTPVDEVTGTSDKLPTETQLKMIREILLEVKNTGIMYTTSKMNSESVIAGYKELAPQYGFEIVDTDISSSADIALTTNTLISKVDCITNLTDSTVVTSLPVILNKTAARNIPVLGSEIEQVKTGCLATMGLNYIELDRQTRKMAAQVLRGEKKANEMNYETIEEAAFYRNTRVTGSLGITLPEDLTRNIAELFTEITR